MANEFKFQKEDFDDVLFDDTPGLTAFNIAQTKLEAWLAAAPVVFGDIDIEHGKPYYSFETIDLGVEGYKAKLVQFKKTMEKL